MFNAENFGATVPSQCRVDSWPRCHIEAPGFSTSRSFWTPHSGRNFLPTAASVLNVPTQEKNLLGGWSAEGSERYNRLAKFKIAQVQRSVIKLIWDKDVLEQQQVWKSERTRRLAENPKAYRAVAGFSSTRFLHFIFVQKGNQDSSQAGTVFCDPWA